MILEQISGFIGCVANLATSIAVVIAARACQLQLKQIKLDSYIRCSERSASFADTLRSEVFPRLRILDYISRGMPAIRKGKKKPDGGKLGFLRRKRVNQFIRCIMR